MLKKLPTYVFYLALTIEIFLVILDKSAYIITNDGQWFRLTFVLFFIKLVLTKYNKKEWIVIGVFTLLGIVSYLITGRNEIIRLIVMIAACKDIKHENMLKFILYWTLTGCLILVVLSLFGIGDFSITRDFGRGEVTTRYCLGLGHPNALHCMFWAICTLFLYVYRARIRWYHLMAMAIANIIMFGLTDSRTGAISTFFTIILTAILSINWIRERKRILLFFIGSELTLAIGSAVAFMERDIYISKLRGFDRLITGRIVWAYLGLPDSEFFFWRPFSTLGRFGPTDLGIVKMIYWYGYIPAIIFMVMCYMLAKTAIKKDDYAVYTMVASIILYSLFEGHDISVYLGRNYIFFLFGKYWIDMFGEKNPKEFNFLELHKCIESSAVDG